MLQSLSGSVCLRLEDLLAAVDACFQVNVVRTAKLARAGVFDIGVHVEPVVRAAHAGAGFRLFTLGDGHGTVQESGYSANPCGTRESAPVNAARTLWQASNGMILRPDLQTKMAGPKAGQGMQEGRRCFALARSLIGSAPAVLVNRGLSLNNGASGPLCAVQAQILPLTCLTPPLTPARHPNP